MLRCTSRCESLIRIHSKIVENLFRPFFPDAECLYKTVKLLKLTDLYKLKVGTYVFGVMNEDLYPSLAGALDLRPVSHEHETRSSGQLRTPFPRVEAMRLGYQHQFVAVWNTIPSCAKQSASVATFKSSLTSYFLNLYWIVIANLLSRFLPFDRFSVLVEA